MAMRVQGMTPEREQFLIENSKWYGRVFKTEKEFPESWTRGSTIMPPNMRAPMYYSWAICTYDRDFATLLNSCTEDCPSLCVTKLIESWGKEGEAYQDAFDACFCEEIFLPLVPELKGGYLPVDSNTLFRMGSDYEVTWWATVEEAISREGFVRATASLKNLHMIFSYWDRDKGIMEQVTLLPTFYRPVVQEPEAPFPDLHAWFKFSEKKPYDGATCDLCSEWSEDFGPMNIQTAEYRLWISHPGGEATANAGPGFVDEHGFPAFEEPIWWRYHEEEPKLIVGTKGPDLGDLESLKDMFYNPKVPDECLPPSSKPTPSEDDDYYSTL